MAARRVPAARARPAARRAGALQLILAVIALAIPAVAEGCGNVASADIALDSTVLRGDFGAAAGSIPSLTCSDGNAAACAALPSPAGVSGWQVGCDATAGQCFGQADLRIAQSIAAASPSSLDSALGRQAARYLRSIDIAYTVPANTLTFRLAKIQLFVVVGGASIVDAGSGASDGGVVVAAAPASSQDLLVGDVDPLAAGQVVTEPGHLSLGQGDAAFDAVSSEVEAGQDLALALVVTPRVLAGAPLPAGAIEVACQPTLHFAVSWSQILP